MMTMFNYNRKDANFNTIIDECLALFEENIEGQSADYKERNKILNAAIAKYAVSGTRFESMFEEKGVEIFKDPRVTKMQKFAITTTLLFPNILTPHFLPLRRSFTTSSSRKSVRLVGVKQRNSKLLRTNFIR